MVDGVPLLFLPGLLCDAELWKAQLDDLSSLARCSVADFTSDDSIADMASRAFADAPPRFAIAAISMGGYVAFEMLRRAPHRITRLALLDTSAAPDTEARSVQRRTAMDAMMTGRFLGVTDKLLPQLVHADHVAGPVGEQVRSMAMRVGRDAFLRQQHAMLHRIDSRPFLKSIDVPTLIAVGDQDRLTPLDSALEIHAHIRGSSFHLFERCGHLPPLEQPAATSRLLRAWLQT